MLKDKLSDLKKTRQFLTESSEVLNKARLEFEHQNQTLINQIANQKENESKLIDDIHEIGLEDYDKRGDKDIGFGVKIRMTTKPSYDDKIALDWAIKHKIALKFDATIFNKFALTLDIDGVTINEIPTVTIPKDIQVD